MQTFAPGPKQLQNTTISKRPASAAVTRHLQNSASGLLHLGRSFSDIPIHAPARRQPAYSKRDANAEPELQPQIAPAPAPPEVAPAVSSLEPQASLSGTIPDIITPPGEGKNTAPESAAAEKADGPMPVGAIPVVANIHLNSSPPRAVHDQGNKTDAVISGVTQGALSQPGGKAVDPFGAESYEPSFTGVAWAFASGKCTISATFNPICPWGTASGGCTDVPSATAPVVTKDNWSAIRDDLKPGASSPFKSKRDKYYSQTLVERHEKFHGTDDNGWTTSSGMGIIKAQLEAGSVATASANADVTALVEAARVKVVAENLKWYKGGGAAHDSYAGEIRAYADGKPEYQKLADGVEKQGKALAAPPAPGP
jgi:hypothetical protein